MSKEYQFIIPTKIDSRSYQERREHYLGDDFPEQRIKFEELISALASRFLMVTSQSLEQAVGETLELIGLNLNVEVCKLVRFPSRPQETWQVQSWTGPGINKQDQDSVIAENYPWINSQILSGKTVVLSNLDDYPVEAIVDKASSQLRGTKSAVVIPLVHSRKTIGFMGILNQSRSLHWPESIVKRLKVIADMLGSMLIRVQSEEKIQQQELESAKLRYALYRSARISAMGEMTAAIAHEINQPLTGILTNAQVAQKYLGGPNPSLQEVKDINRDIISDVKRARDVMLKLRALFQKSNIEFIPLDINTLIKELIPLIQSHLAMRQTTYNENLERNLPLIKGDRIQLQQVLINLMSNGLEAMKDSAVRELHLSTKRVEDNICIKVTNTGPVISEKDFGHLFEPFFTTKLEGMGMGLSINKAIVTAHNGQITVKNNSPRGVTFAVTLPSIQSASENILI